ncbi:MAG: PTS fructose transporter subunit IIA [Gammaproteobacteria bacterium]|nr:PTS fructose transporter subunit IIA [Gammaproteobacteria bacterium]
MNVGLLLITHEGIGSILLDTAKKMLGICPLSTRVIEVPLDAPVDIIKQQALQHIDSLDQGKGVLILTDLYGSTPSNIAHQLLTHSNSKLVTGINLPMLVRILNYPQSTLNEMALKALTGGHDGILLSDNENIEE